MKKIVVFILLVLSACALSSAFCTAQEPPLYKIKLDRGNPSPGDRCQFALDQRIHMMIQARPTTQSTTATSPHYSNTMYAISGVCEVLTVEAHRTCKIRFTVETALFNCRTVLPPGTVIIAENMADHVHYLIDGQPPNHLTLGIAKLVPLKHDLIPNNRDLSLLTATPRRIGEVWNGDPHFYVQYLAAQGTILREKDVTLTSELLGLEQINSQQLMQVQIHMDTQNVNRSTASAQSTTNSRSQITLTLPLDERILYPSRLFMHSVREEHVIDKGGKTPIDEDRTYDVVTHIHESAMPATQPTTASTQP